MKDVFKYAGYIVFCLTIAYVCATLKDCGEVGKTSDLVVVPRDSAYLPITMNEYKPPSTPFEDPVKPVSKLPIGVKERDVKRVIKVRKLSTSDTLVIILTKSGEVLVPKQTDSIAVNVFDYVPPLLQFGLFYGFGVTLNAESEIDPAVSLSLIRINEKFSAPVIAADLHSIGVGAGYQFYHDLTVTPLMMWNYSDTQRTIKIQVSYQL
ncbi:MAG: hypothetical protein HYV29_01755 [Ignavibacteriales bacterium]|nr:hypothetical protein [Ignavibacteriales bacterium]